MSQTQRDHYEGATEVNSDPIGFLDRDNRNHRKKFDIIVENIDAEKGDRVLEVGCGHGLHAESYAKQFEYTGIDVSESFVDETRRRVATVADNYTVARGDAMDLDFANNEFDAVVGTAILHHLHSPRQALAEWQRVASGSVTLMEPNYLFPKEFLSTHLAEHERHKINMRPWHIQKIVDSVTPPDAEWRVEPRIYTPPWPARFKAVYDGIDKTVLETPGVRWLSQMLLIHIEC